MKFYRKFITTGFLGLIALFTLWFFCFAILETLKNNGDSFIFVFLSVFATPSSMVLFIFKILSIGNVEIRDNIIVKRIFVNNVCLNIDEKLKIKYGIIFLRLSNNGKNIILEKEDMDTYLIICEIYNKIKEQHRIQQSELIAYCYKNKLAILIIPFLLIMTIGLLAYIFLFKIWWFIVLPVLVGLFFVIFFLFDKKIEIFGKNIITTSFFGSRECDMSTLKNVRTEILQIDLKLYIRFCFNNKYIMISTVGYTAGYSDIIKLFDILYFYNYNFNH